MSNGVPFADRAAVYDLMWARGEVGMLIVAKDGAILDANPRICELLGYTPVELVGKTFQEITKHDDVGPDVEMLRRLLLGEIDHYKMDKTYYKKDGLPLFIRLVVWPILDPETKEPRVLFSQVIPKRIVTQPEQITTTEVSAGVVLAKALADNKALAAAMVTAVAGFITVFGSILQAFADHLLDK